MCLITKNKKFILDKDLFVYKIVDIHPIYDTIRSNFHSGFTYELNTVYNTDIKTSDDYTFFDSLSRISVSPELGLTKHTSISYSLISYGEGFHSGLSVERLLAVDLMNRQKISLMTIKPLYKCKIAKGSECIIDETGLVISSSIELISRVKFIDYIEVLESYNRLNYDEVVEKILESIKDNICA